MQALFSRVVLNSYHFHASCNTLPHLQNKAKIWTSRNGNRRKVKVKDLEDWQRKQWSELATEQSSEIRQKRNMVMRQLKEGFISRKAMIFASPCIC